MKTRIDCDYCGSAGSVEFNMCQVCLKEYSGAVDRRGGKPRVTALGAEVNMIIAGKNLVRPPVFARGNRPS